VASVRLRTGDPPPPETRIRQLVAAARRNPRGRRERLRVRRV